MVHIVCAVRVHIMQHPQNLKLTNHEKVALVKLITCAESHNLLKLSKNKHSLSSQQI